MIGPSTYTSRQSRFAGSLPGDSLAVVSRGSDIRWLTGFTGSSGVLVVERDGVVLFTDGRYQEQAAQEATVRSVHIVRGELIEAVYEALRERTTRDLRIVLFQADDLTYDRAERLRNAAGGMSLDLEPLGAALSELRSVKDEGEVSLICEALAISEDVMTGIRAVLRPGITEREVAAEIDYRHRLKGADGAAFDTIVAFGDRAALPHARPGSTRLESGQCILMDFGCIVGSYRSDITRTLVLGEPPDGFEDAYAAVETALCAAQEQAAADMDGRELDAVARTSLESVGLADRFSHGLGHGVGLDIHEHPRVSSVVRSRLRLGTVITVEPGVYIPGRFGIRIENMVHITSAGARILNSLDTGLVRL